MSNAPKLDDIRRMQHIQLKVRELIEEYRSNTEAAVIAGALTNVMRELLDAYPPEVRDLLMEGMIAFLQRRDVETEQRMADLAAKGIVIPPWAM